MTKEELFKKYQEIVLKTNGGNDDYVVALCQISNLIKEFAETQDKQFAELKAENERSKEESKNYCKDFIEISQKLKEKEQEHELLINDFERETENLRRQIKFESDARKRAVERINSNTKQVCEKIRQKAEEIAVLIKNGEIVKYTISASKLDQIEKGEENAKNL